MRYVFEWNIFNDSKLRLTACAAFHNVLFLTHTFTDIIQSIVENMFLRQVTVHSRYSLMRTRRSRHSFREFVVFDKRDST